MKKSLLILMLSAFTLNVSAQKNVILKIKHQLESADFAFNQEATNNLGNNFNVERLEYYLSTILIIHDSGQTTPATDVYILVNAGTETSVLLGSYNVTNIEGITFSVGVNTPVNNEDPTLWPNGHPLALKTPSMHWGWAAGYIFAAIEGNAGNNMTTFYEINALGNGNYFSTTVNTTAADVDNNLEITVYADYRETIRNIPVSQGVSIHGETDEAVTFLENFKNHVFSPTPKLAGMKTLEVKSQLKTYPNPSQGDFKIEVPNDSKFDKIILTDLTGRILLTETVSPASDYSFHIDTKGLYFIQVYKDNVLIGNQKMVIE